jgi:hypothetical protein
MCDGHVLVRNLHVWLAATAATVMSWCAGNRLQANLTRPCNAAHCIAFRLPGPFAIIASQAMTVHSLHYQSDKELTNGC